MADALGCTLDELGDLMSAEEYALRVRLHDEGRALSNQLLASLLAMTFNIHRPQNSRHMTASDWLPQRAAPQAPSAPATFADAQSFIADLEKQSLPPSDR